ncbi:hypothetical protein [Curtobacterium sp. 458]|uniref:hypothetical protein n=1 Tax=Curtobacterium sp. 458 TaxID=3050069 RepID=UPI0025B29C2C|nr:hypothetical protein [Curtobacterium sp. 458]WJY01040.1 hypothetical protein QPJ90_04900 [Curtobacterium sp. 458]
MSSKKHQRVAAIGLGPLVVAASTLLVAPANAATRTAEAADISSPATSVLKEIRRELVISGSGAELASFDRLSSTQRNELASYFLYPAPRGNPNASGAPVEHGTVRSSGDFEWGVDFDVSEAETPLAEQPGITAASRSSWGTQWFSFAGIKLTETKVSMTYEYSGTTARKMLGYSCTVVRNIQPFTEVRTSKNSGYVSGGQATSKCKVVVKRGVLTPWGTVAWSTYSAIQRLSARGNGAITANRWE